MCIALLTTEHPRYPYILASNRDEFISRPTAAAEWWSEPDGHVLGGRDLERSEHGTWLGVTRQGRIACLTNFRESDADRPISGLKSRGGIVNSFLKTPPSSTESTADSAKRLVEDDGVMDVGGFSLLFGRLTKPYVDGKRDPLAIISNRTSDVKSVTWVANDSRETLGLSNSYYGDTTWPKVTNGEHLVKQALTEHANDVAASKESLVERLFAILTVDTLPKWKTDEAWDSFVLQLRNSIFIPKVGGEVESLKNDEVAASNTNHQIGADESTGNSKGVYATHQQSVIVVDNDGHVSFTERTLYANPDGSSSTKQYEFDVEGW